MNHGLLIALRTLLVAFTALVAVLGNPVLGGAGAHAQSVVERLQDDGEVIRRWRRLMNENSLQFLMGTEASFTAHFAAIDAAAPRAYATFRRVAGPEDPETIEAGWYVARHALRTGDFVTAEIVSRERIAGLPRALERLDAMQGLRTAEREPEAHTVSLCSAHWQLFDALEGQERWPDAVNAARALTQPCGDSARVRGALADALDGAGGAGAAESGEHRIAEISLLLSASQPRTLCGDNGRERVRRLETAELANADRRRREALLVRVRETCAGQPQ